MPAARAAAAAALLGLAAGCSIHVGPLGVSVGGGDSSGSWGGGTTGTTGVLPDGRVGYEISHLTRDNAVFLVIVAEGVGGSSGTHGGPPGGGTFEALDGRTITWESATDDGKSGTVTVAGSEFLLEDGGLFLVSARGGRTYVRQAKADLSKLKGGVTLAAVRGAVTNDAVTADFLRAVDRPQPGPK
ncbi:MAG: hypothetical protein K2P78_11045 [Gemmataceae bacterium]|nr:hypothetical protein [Gemmataceae bacterium]